MPYSKPCLLIINMLLENLPSFFIGKDASSVLTLIFLMAIDYITGMLVALVFKRSKKTDTGGLSSHVGWYGIVKKIITLAIVSLSHRLDLLLGTSIIKECVTIAYIINELISIVENAGLIGVPIPQTLMDSIDLLKSNREKKL